MFCHNFLYSYALFGCIFQCLWRINLYFHIIILIYCVERSGLKENLKARVCIVILKMHDSFVKKWKLGIDFAFFLVIYARSLLWPTLKAKKACCDSSNYIVERVGLTTWFNRDVVFKSKLAFETKVLNLAMHYWLKPIKRFLSKEDKVFIYSLYILSCICF